MRFKWPYYMLRDGKLLEEYVRYGRAYYRCAFPKAPLFANAAEAEAWLEAQDERGNVREG